MCIRDRDGICVLPAKIKPCDGIEDKAGGLPDIIQPFFTGKIIIYGQLHCLAVVLIDDHGGFSLRGFYISVFPYLLKNRPCGKRADLKLRADTADRREPVAVSVISGQNPGDKIIIYLSLIHI